jgi:hypothetical protein
MLIMHFIRQYSISDFILMRSRRSPDIVKAKQARRNIRGQLEFNTIKFFRKLPKWGLKMLFRKQSSDLIYQNTLPFFMLKINCLDIQFREDFLFFVPTNFEPVPPGLIIK